MSISPKTKMSSYAALVVGAVMCASLASGKDATADATSPLSGGGTQSMYGGIAPDQIESLSTPDRIKSVAASGSMLAIWQTLEHAEKVECLDCIGPVAELMNDPNPRTREIAVWWLRRRTFGVFTQQLDKDGKPTASVYDATISQLANHPDALTRSYAAQALGEFLLLDGVPPLKDAIQKDSDPRVRAAAASALGRLNDDGKGALSIALGDGDASVKLAALKSAGRINGFGDSVAVIKLAADGDTGVRRNAAQLIGSLRMKDGVDSLLTLAKDSDANVRNAACHSLGALHDARARDVLTDIAAHDSDGLVRDQAQIALRRL